MVVICYVSTLSAVKLLTYSPATVLSLHKLVQYFIT